MGHFCLLIPSRTHFATGSRDGTIRIWTLVRILNDIVWKLRNNNWVAEENSKLMVWILTDLGRYLRMYRNVNILGRSFHLKLRFGSG